MNLALWIAQLTFYNYGVVTMTLEELLQEVKDQGLLLNNLFQLDDGRWQCNLRQDKGDHWLCCAYAIASTPQLALLEALAKPRDIAAYEVIFFAHQKPKPLTLKDIGLKR
jgi:hypothetical protein